MTEPNTSESAERRIAVRVTRDALRQVRGGSPWVYDGSIVSVSHDGSVGDLAVIFDERRAFAAIGLWDPTSPIRVKVLHTGRPQPIDDEFWRRRIDAALDRRRPVIADPDTTGFRLVHGENDSLPGLVVDVYADTAVVKVYTPAWFPRLDRLVGIIVERCAASNPLRRVVVRLSRTVAASAVSDIVDGAVVVGPALDGPVMFRERGLTLEADVVSGSKTGHFLDQRDNRVLVRSMALGCEVLDVFSSTGGFAVSAAAGGAASVHMIDQSASAVETARRNIAHNRRSAEVRRCTVTADVGDAFDLLAGLARRERRFDLVVVDPPSFASNRRAVPRALAAYGRLTRLALGVTRPGGMLVQCSCSSRVGAEDFHSTVTAAARSVGRTIHTVRRTGHGIDHPVGFEHGEYLKAVYATV